MLSPKFNVCAKINMSVANITRRTMKPPKDSARLFAISAIKADASPKANILVYERQSLKKLTMS